MVEVLVVGTVVETTPLRNFLYHVSYSAFLSLWCTGQFIFFMVRSGLVMLNFGSFLLFRGQALRIPFGSVGFISGKSAKHVHRVCFISRLNE